MLELADQVPRHLQAANHDPFAAPRDRDGLIERAIGGVDEFPSGPGDDLILVATRLISVFDDHGAKN